MRRILTMLFVSVFMLSLCPLHAQETETLVLIDTDMGKIKVKLFNDTPLHRDNFIKNVKEHEFTPEQKEAYMLEGGTPHLDGNYTVFGEVIQGMKVVDKIQFVETNAEDRPTKNIKIKSMKLIEK